MIPKEIAFQLVQLKEKVKTYSSIQRSLDVAERRDEVDEIKEAVENANSEIADLVKKMNNILVDGWISNLEIEDWFEDLKDKSDFPEPNPREIYEEEQRELERQRKIAEEKARKEREEYQKKLKTKRIEEYQNLCYYGPDDFDKVQQLIKDGFDIKQDGKIYDLSTLIDLGRSMEFIEFLIKAGMKINNDDQLELERQREIATERVKQKFEEIERQKKIEEEKAIKEAEEHQKRLQTQRIEEFKKMCQSGGEDINKLKKLINEGLDINKIKDFDCLERCISWSKSLAFIQFLVDSGLLVKNKHIEYCYTHLKKIKNSTSIISILEKAKYIENDAVKNILKRKKTNVTNVIGSISMLCICIIGLMMPHILDREMDGFYYVFIGIMTILFLLMVILSIVELRKKR